MKKIVMLSVAIVGSVYAKGTWSGLNESDTDAANSYACAKFVMKVGNQPQPDLRRNTAGQPVFSPTQSKKFENWKARKLKWFERRKAHSSFDPSRQDHEAALGLIYTQGVEQFPGLITYASRLFSYMQSSQLTLHKDVLVQVLDDHAHQRVASIEGWSDEGLAHIFGLWRAWNWTPPADR